MRDTLADELKRAMKAGEKRRVETLRLILAGLKNRDIEAKAVGQTVGDTEIMALLQKMIKSRKDAIDLFVKGGRQDLADREAEEVAILSEFVPEAMTEEELVAAVRASIEKAGASAPSDIGKVIKVLKIDFPGRVDMARANPLIRTALAKQ